MKELDEEEPGKNASISFETRVPIYRGRYSDKIDERINIYHKFIGKNNVLFLNLFFAPKKD